MFEQQTEQQAREKILELVAEYCDRMVIMQAGAAVASGTVAEIREMGREEDGALPSLEEAFVNIIRRGRGEREGAE